MTSDERWQRQWTIETRRQASPNVVYGYTSLAESIKI
jgi:hypothetical protein